MKRFFERDHDVRLDVAAAFGPSLALTERTPAKSRLASAPEKCLEEVTESGAAELEIDSTAVAWRVPPESAARRRLKPAARLVPVRP